MQAGSGSIFQPELATGPSLAVELISSHARIGGSINLGAYTAELDVHLDGLTIVVDHSTTCQLRTQMQSRSGRIGWCS